MALFKLFLSLTCLHAVLASGSEPQVECSPELMNIVVPLDGDRRIAYLDQLKGYNLCEPELNGKTAVFLLDIQDPHKCGVTRVLNKMTGKRVFYTAIRIENTDGSTEEVRVRCDFPGKQRVSRDVQTFPLDFDEPDVLNITRYEEGKAPEPVLTAIVKQNGKQVSGEISVTPGTPLTMEIFLNKQSASIYGLLANYMHVTDTGKQQETIILNGCSVDPYLFENFVTTDGDTLTAKFKAFKFPDTTYVQFKATVTVCLDMCQGVQCSNGMIAYGRKRRSIASTDSNIEVSLTTFIKVDYEKGQENTDDILTLIRNLKVADQTLGDTDGTPATVEQTKDNALAVSAPNATEYNKSNMAVYSSILILTCLLVLLK